MLTGIIIEESLGDSSILKQLTITKTETELITEGHKTPWVNQWTMHDVEVSEDDIDHVAQSISESIDSNHANSWYADLKNETTHYIIFREKVFKIDRTKKSEYDVAAAYGVSIGIPEYQLDFSPYITEWER